MLCANDNSDVGDARQLVLHSFEMRASNANGVRIIDALCYHQGTTTARRQDNEQQISILCFDSSGVITDGP
jgi:hypothetical protein